MTPLVYIVILNWNGLDDTLACLESLATCKSLPGRVVTLVIDNASRVDPRPAITTRFPAVQVERAAANLGFAGGCNAGMSRALQAGADYVLLLNNDTYVAPDFLKRLLSFADQHPEAGIVAPLLCDAADTERVQARGGRVLLALGHAFHADAGVRRDEVSLVPSSWDFVSGCCMLIPAATLRAVGAFDERFFAYYEDVDFCLRVRRQGMPVVCVPTSVVWHKESASTRRDLVEGSTSPLKHYLMMRNRIATVRRNGNPWEQACFFVGALPMLVLFYLAAFTLRRRWQKLIWMLLGAVDGLAGTFPHTRIAAAGTPTTRRAEGR